MLPNSPAIVGNFRASNNVRGTGGKTGLAR